MRTKAAARLVTLTLLAIAAAPAHAGTFDCAVVYDEFDSLMNKSFLLEPGQYVKVATGKLSRADYNSRQKGRLLLRPGREGMGVAVVHTNGNSWGKFLFTWGGRGDSRGNPLLILRDVTLFGRVEDGHGRKVRREVRIPSSLTADLDSGLTGQGGKDDVWFHNVDGKTMYVEAVNGARISFPLESLCR